MHKYALRGLRRGDSHAWADVPTRRRSSANPSAAEGRSPAGVSVAPQGPIAHAKKREERMRNRNEGRRERERESMYELEKEVPGGGRGKRLPMQ